jgi:hypothetical protein
LITPYFSSKPAGIFMRITVYMAFVEIEMCMGGIWKGTHKDNM